MTVFDHVDLRVADVERCRQFYDAFLREYGFRGKTQPDGAQLYYRLEEREVREVIVVSADPEHRPTATCLAFRAETRADVDRIAAVAEAAGARAFEAPGPCPEYTESYYAAFFEDPDGNRLEVVCR
ncbi:MAG TPA: VOC family protein [Candidatus Elarobacter sp.]|jgi:catechol 2,3-dioxygenase-like lactoylglutathione lyase family enzyme